jgi:ribonuclease HII
MRQKPDAISEIEWNRLQKLLEHETKARTRGHRFIAGVDEAGRGPLAGPVVAAACIIPEGHYLPGIDDSKKLPPKKRQQLFDLIVNDPHISFAIAQIDSDIIDEINIYQATVRAMLSAVDLLEKQPDCLLVDGMSLPHPTLPIVKIIRGDSLSQSIAAASILAKVTRDRLMNEFHQQWPDYGFDQHKGYGTPQHLEAIQKHGVISIHRRSFEPVASNIKTSAQK